MPNLPPRSRSNVSACLVPVLVVMLCVPGVLLANSTERGQATFTNPIATGADPWVITWKNTYYSCRPDHTSIFVHKATRLPEIHADEGVRVWTPPPGTGYSKELWAPELHRLDGRWYIYVAADEGHNKNHRIYVLEGSGDDPQAPFEFKGKLSAPTDRWAIDGTVLVIGNAKYFIWSGWEGTQNVQQNLYIAPMSNPWTISGERVCISEPTYAWEKHGKPLINEGPEVLAHDGKIFVIYSASGSWTDNYCLGQLALTGVDPLKKSAWVKKPTPVFSRTDSVFGPGHASFVKSLDGTEDWIVYHAARERGSGWDRTIRIQRFRWNADGSPDFGVPISPGVPVECPRDIPRAWGVAK